MASGVFVGSALAAPLPGGSLDLSAVPKFVTPLVIPPAMPRSESDPNVDYQIAVKQFRQQILPSGYPATTVWGYGSVDDPATFHSPSFTIEAEWNQPLTIKWVNGLVDGANRFLPHLLPVDQALHWANPPQKCADGTTRTDCEGFLPGRYVGPVPMVTHVHGAHVGDESDGYPEAWYLPAAKNIPPGYATRGSHFGQVVGAPDGAGQAIFRYPNDQPATTLWYHDHTLGMTRLNVYAGPAGFYLLRGGPGDQVLDRDTLQPATLPGPAPRLDNTGPYYEIPIAIQDRMFNKDGSLFYPQDRAFFDVHIAPIPATDLPRKWNPEVFGNAMMVNGSTWPFLQVEPRRYRLRFLNGCQSRFLILKMDASAPIPFWQIGAEGGFLREPVELSQLLVAPAERADVIVDFSALSPGDKVTLVNLGPDEPFGGGTPGVDFEPSDPDTTGQVMQFQVVALASADTTTPPDRLVLPEPVELGASSHTRTLSLNEMASGVLCYDAAGHTISCASPGAVDFFAPEKALLGTFDPATGMTMPMPWMDVVTERPLLGATETWEIYNFTEDAHPIHLHLVQFEVVNRQALAIDAESEPSVTLAGDPRGPEPWESGRKDTVVVYPGEVARVKAKFDVPGLFVWHCHILEHEDNEMMRPYVVIGP